MKTYHICEVHFWVEAESADDALGVLEEALGRRFNDNVPFTFDTHDVAIEEWDDNG